MTGLRPDGGGPPPAPPDRRTFMDALTSDVSPLQPPVNAESLAKLGQYKGEIAAFFPKASIQKLSQPFRYALVGKFSQGRPLMEIIHKFFVAQDFKDLFTVGLLDSKHVIINMRGEADFLRVYSRMTWHIAGKPMRVFKWTHQFHVDKESSLVPIWIKFPKLPAQFFNKDAMFTLASLFGNPLRLDSATTNFKRPSVARIQVEIDLLKPIPPRLWIGMEESQGFWQAIELDEELPTYCSHCWHIGHEQSVCYVKNPELKIMDREIRKKETEPVLPRMVYRPKTTQQLEELKDLPLPAEKTNPSSSGLNQVEKQNIPIDVCSSPVDDILDTKVVHKSIKEMQNTQNQVVHVEDGELDDQKKYLAEDFENKANDSPILTEDIAKEVANKSIIVHKGKEKGAEGTDRKEKGTEDFDHDDMEILLQGCQLDEMSLKGCQPSASNKFSISELALLEATAIHCYNPSNIDPSQISIDHPQPLGKQLRGTFSDPKQLQQSHMNRSEQLQDFRSFSEGISSKIVDAEGFQPVKKKRSRKNYFDQTQTMTTRSLTISTTKDLTEEVIQNLVQEDIIVAEGSMNDLSQQFDNNKDAEESCEEELDNLVDRGNLSPRISGNKFIHRKSSRSRRKNIRYRDFY